LGKDYILAQVCWSRTMSYLAKSRWPTHTHTHQRYSR